MWFLYQIVSWLGHVRDYLFDAYIEVSGWYHPFNNLAYPLYWLYYAFYYITYYFGLLSEWLNWAASRIDQILSISTIQSYFQAFINYASWAWSWISNAWSNVTSIINTWWSSTQQTILVWINNAAEWLQAQVDGLGVWVSNLQASVNNLLAQIPSINELIAWFSDWWPKILTPLTSWWNEKLLDIESLVQSEIKDWFPFYDELTSLWNSIKEFFTDPEDWLYKAVDRIIERFW